MLSHPDLEVFQAAPGSTDLAACTRHATGGTRTLSESGATAREDIVWKAGEFLNHQLSNTGGSPLLRLDQDFQRVGFGGIRDGRKQLLARAFIDIVKSWS